MLILHNDHPRCRYAYANGGSVILNVCPLACIAARGVSGGGPQGEDIQEHSPTHCCKNPLGLFLLSNPLMSARYAHTD